MHVHVGIPDDDLRIDLMSQVSYVLPHLLALSTSSPFWRGTNTGLMSYRVAVFDELPRTGLPEQFDSWGEYQRHVRVLVDAGLIEDASKLWWDVRPSARFPTLEMRITDVCTRLEDAIAIAALYRCWLRMLWRLRRNNQRWRRYAGMLIHENRWLAQRYGYAKGLVDFGKGEVVPYADLLEEMLEIIAPDAAHFACEAEVAHARTILARGTSAHWQIAAFAEARKGGASEAEALAAVVAMLARESLAGLAAHDPAREECDRARGRRLPPPGAASARAHRRAEHRPHEPGRLLPQLPLALVSRGGGGARAGLERRQGARARLRHALRRVEGEAPEGSLGRAESRPRQGGSGASPLSGRTAPLPFDMYCFTPTLPLRGAGGNFSVC